MCLPLSTQKRSGTGQWVGNQQSGGSQWTYYWHLGDGRGPPFDVERGSKDEEERAETEWNWLSTASVLVSSILNAHQVVSYSIKRRWREIIFSLFFFFVSRLYGIQMGWRTFKNIDPDGKPDNPSRCALHTQWISPISLLSERFPTFFVVLFLPISFQKNREESRGTFVFLFRESHFLAGFFFVVYILFYSILRFWRKCSFGGLLILWFFSGFIASHFGFFPPCASDDNNRGETQS